MRKTDISHRGSAERDSTFRFGATYYGGKFDNFGNHHTEFEGKTIRMGRSLVEALN
jgi:hypothetical protein